jgi:hypothetical protein
MSNDDKCPCVDGLPGPCTLCGAPADGVCEIDTLVGWKHRAQRAEAEVRQLREAIGDPDELIANAHYGRAANGHGDDLFATVSRIAAAVAEGAEDRGQTDG